MNAELYPRLLAQLAEPAARALALAVLVGAGLAFVRTHAASVKFTVWRAVLAGALAMPLLARLAPGLPVILPRPAWADAALASIPETGPSGRDLLSSAPEATAQTNLQGARRADQPANPRQDAGQENEIVFRALASSRLQPHAAAHVNPKRALPWGPIATLIYSLGAAALLARLVLGWVFSRKLARSAEKVTDLRLLALFAEQTEALGPATAVRRSALAVSNSVSVPVTLGTLAPVVVLPAGSADWDERKCRAICVPNGDQSAASADRKSFGKSVMVANDSARPATSQRRTWRARSGGSPRARSQARKSSPDRSRTARMRRFLPGGGR